MQSEGTAITQEDRDVWRFTFGEETFAEGRTPLTLRPIWTQLVLGDYAQTLDIDFLLSEAASVHPDQTILGSEVGHTEYFPGDQSVKIIRGNEHDAYNEHRIQLLARLYAHSNLSREEVARLEILNERVRQLLPSVTDEEVETLERIHEQLQEITAADTALREKYGITG